ncbi:hypothetical protein [Corallococcus macrosporus]|uniref:Uncharacterized protein n=2 Tax=Myxococcaceae TaxID=31 RepID=A0A250JLP1_9BACT|nr:hypothetical protein [Corallococcus macrosporus]AEI63300.1 hypothetical protein LILAB_06925 [Corallococcus macrosporus]ATB44799.1 hypothetical protein MYMAC_000376 [Corallococcus macrosporus DSM 14697]
MAETEFTSGASCPLHPGFEAVGTCARCGNFMCRTCSQGGSQAWCPTCRQREGAGQAFPLNRENWGISGLLDVCWAAFKREWVMLCVGVLIFIAASIAGQVVSQIFSVVAGVVDNVAITVLAILLGTIASYVIQGGVTLGFLRMCMDVLAGQRADLGRLFSQFHKVPAYVGTLFLSFVLMVPLLLLIVIVAVGAGLATGTVSWAELVGLGDLSSSELDSALRPMLPGLAVMGLVAFALYIFPGGWLLAPLILMQPELARTDSPRVVETLRRCFVYARGQRLAMVGTLLLGGLITVVGVFLCCVPVIPATSFLYLLLAGLSLTLSRGAEEA